MIKQSNCFNFFDLLIYRFIDVRRVFCKQSEQAALRTAGARIYRARNSSLSKWPKNQLKSPARSIVCALIFNVKG